MITDALLPIIWFGIICTELALYAILDGANLGVGMLSLFPQPEKKRSLIIHTLGPIWNANETWLLVAAGSLFGAFPVVYSTMLNALYVPGMIIVVGLILRAVSFEFHDVADKSRALWSKFFGIGSLLTVLGQGMLFGGILSGIPMIDGRFAGGPFTWATPLTLLITVGFFFAYAVVGYAYLIKRTYYEIRHETFPRIALAAGFALVALLGATLVLPKTNYIFFERWTMSPSSTILFVVASLIASAIVLLTYVTVKRKYPKTVYYLCLAIFALGYVGMLVGTYPYMLPPSLTLFQAASPASTLRFMLYGIGPLLPIIFAYNWYLAYVFRDGSKEGKEEGY
jgi:cytochrome d ubiquinol oxidase subunit II